MAAEKLIETSRYWVRSAWYWVLLLWLVLFTAITVGIVEALYEDFDTHRRVYRSIAFYEAMVWIYAVLHVVGLGAQVYGCRTQRSSWLGVLAPVVFIGGQLVIVLFDLNPSCCG